MDLSQGFFGTITNLFIFFLVIAGVWKIFQIGTDVRELKDAVNNLKKNAQPFSPVLANVASLTADGPPPVPGQISAEDLVRAVHAQSFDDDSPVFYPTVLPPK